MADAKADAKAEEDIFDGGSFSENLLVEKLDMLRNAVNSIQTLSNWCIFHRKRARKIVDTWKKQFKNADKDKTVALLYVSNDILQNSKRKGGEFVNEFWKILPGLLKDLYENEKLKNTVSRLIRIWDERKVFGTRIESLKAEVLGDNRIIKKLTVGGMPEKIVTAYESVLARHFDEDTTLNKCKSTVRVLEKMDKDVDDACNHGVQQVSSLMSNLQEQEAILKKCIEQLESVGTARITLINKLKEALSEQEAKSELLHNELQVARAQTEHTMQLKQRLDGALTNGAGSSSSPLMVAPPEQTAAVMQNSAVRPVFPQFQPLHPATSVPATSSAVFDEPKKTAAAMAEKLASLSAPAQVLSSIFSSFAAEQAASMNDGSSSGELSAGPPGFETKKKPRIENPMHASDMGAPPGFFGQLPQLQQQIGATTTSLGVTQPSTQANQVSAPFPPLPPPLPLMQQFSQNTGGMFGMGHFGMMPGHMPPPPLLPNALSAGYPRPSGPPPPPPLPPVQNQNQPQQQQSPQAPQQSPISTGFFQTPGPGFFAPVQVQQPPPVQRQ